MPEMPTVSLVIPMFNEEENIAQTLRVSIAALERHASDYEILVVDDASTDGSPQIVAEIARENPKIRTIRHDRNRKLGGSLKTGFASAGLELVLYMDADLASDPEELGRAIRAMGLTRADVIAGYRFDRTTEGVRRTIYSAAYNALVNVLFGWPYRDINFAFKLIRREVLNAIELKSEGSLIDAELIIKAKNLGFVVQQIGLDYFPRSRGRSNLSSPAVIFKILRELIVLYPEMRRPRRRGEAAAGASGVAAEMHGNEAPHRHGG